MVTRTDLFTELEYEIQYMSEGTKSQYRAKVSDYLDWIKKRGTGFDKWQDRDTLYKYIEYLKTERHLSQATINYILRGAIGALFRMQQPSLRLPVKLPKIARGQMHQTESKKAFTVGEIAKLIETARHSGNPQWQNIMALTSIYGLRAGEVQQMKKEDMHPLKKTITVHTEKGGTVREQLVPKIIAPYLFNYWYPEIPGKKVHTVFGEIADAAGVSHGDRKNIHAVRHAVVTALSDVRDANDQLIFGQTDVYFFVRWAIPGIIATYNHAKELENDERIFKHHPFLKYWKGNAASE
jgi:integrase